MVSRAFVKARSKVHNLVRAEADKAFDLMALFMRQVKGDINSKEMGRLFHEAGMPYPAGRYLAARQMAGVAIKKSVNRNSGSHTRWHALRRGWVSLLEKTPIEKRPRTIHDLVTKDPPLVPAFESAPGLQVEEVPINPKVMLKDVPLDDLLAELRDRRSQAEETIAKLKSIGPLVNIAPEG